MGVHVCVCVPHSGPVGLSPAVWTRCSGPGLRALDGCGRFRTHTGVSASDCHRPDLGREEAATVRFPPTEAELRSVTPSPAMRLSLEEEFQGVERERLLACIKDTRHIHCSAHVLLHSSSVYFSSVLVFDL